MLRHVPVLILALTLTACGPKPNYVRPDVDLPAKWRDVPADGAPVQGAQWWKVYGDPVLDRLIDEALAANANLVGAVARVEEARAVLAATATSDLPAMTANVRSDRTRLSERGAMPLQSGTPTTSDTHRLTLDVAYEADLWGRLGNATEAARADLLATEAARDTVLITLTSDVAQAYFGLRALDEQLGATRRTLSVRNEALAIQKKRVDLGDLSGFEYAQLAADVAADRARVPVLAERRSRQQNALAVLLGRSPRAIYETSLDAASDPETQTSPVVVPAGLPSDLLLRRPDLVQAEQTLIAANTRIAAARAAYFPRIALTAFLGSESAALSDLFSGPAAIWQIAGALAQPIFAGRRVDADVRAATARERQAVAQYTLAIQNAFREVRDALVAQTAAGERLVAERDRVEALRSATRLARLRYGNGMVSQLEVLDAERNLLAAEQDRIDALRAQRAAIADLYKALGGAWS